MRKILSVFSSRRKGAGNGVPVTTQMFQNFFSCTKLWNFDLKSIVRMTTKKHFEAEVKYSNKAVDARHDSTSHIKSHRRHQVTPSCQQTLTENALQLKHSHQKFSCLGFWKLLVSNDERSNSLWIGMTQMQCWVAADYLSLGGWKMNVEWLRHTEALTHFKSLLNEPFQWRHYSNCSSLMSSHALLRLAKTSRSTSEILKVSQWANQYTTDGFSNAFECLMDAKSILHLIHANF